jgi:hypothetical protein
MKHNSNNFEIYLATKKHHHTPPRNLQFFGAHNSEQVHDTYHLGVPLLEEIATVGMGYGMTRCYR